MSRSHWYDESLAIIDRVMRTIPAGTDPAECRRIVNAAWPGGPRAYHPYKMWLRALRYAMQIRFPQSVVREPSSGCPACGGVGSAGCLFCKGEK